MKKINIRISFFLVFLISFISIFTIPVSAFNSKSVDRYDKTTSKKAISVNESDYKKAYNDLPEYLKDMLEKYDWQIKVLSNEEMIIEDGKLNHKYGPQGITDYDEKTIYLNTLVNDIDLNLLHEIGHAFGYHTDVDLSEEFCTLYSLEYGGVKNTYAGKNNVEFFAEVFSWVVTGNEQKDKVPKSAEFIETLLKKANTEYLKGEEIKLKNASGSLSSHLTKVH